MLGTPNRGFICLNVMDAVPELNDAGSPVLTPTIDIGVCELMPASLRAV